jgi:hypothetical protein
VHQNCKTHFFGLIIALSIVILLKTQDLLCSIFIILIRKIQFLNIYRKKYLKIGQSHRPAESWVFNKITIDKAIIKPKKCVLQF